MRARPLVVVLTVALVLVSALGACGVARAPSMDPEGDTFVDDVRTARTLSEEFRYRGGGGRLLTWGA
ncbi:MAG TPA: hypothetical protein VFV66_00955 [Nonomuraea sp.]|nr:hypothetical protein [Nonomuraea sp.]